MLPFTEIPKRKLSYSLPAENNIPGEFPYICIDFDKASNMEIDEFERAVKNTTWDGFSIYKLNLATPASEDEMAKYHSWETDSSERQMNSSKSPLDDDVSGSRSFIEYPIHSIHLPIQSICPLTF